MLTDLRSLLFIVRSQDCPQGMRLMKPAERDATAAELEKVRLKLLKALSQLPVSAFEGASAW